MADPDRALPLLHFHIYHVLRGTEHEAREIGIGVLVLDDLILDKAFHDGEIRELQIFVLAQEPGGHCVVDFGAEILEGGLSLVRVFGNSDIGVSVQEGIHKIPEPVGRTLLIIVYEDDIIAVCKVTAADQCVVAPAVLGEVDGEDLGIIFRLFSDDGEQIIR